MSLRSVHRGLSTRPQVSHVLATNGSSLAPRSSFVRRPFETVIDIYNNFEMKDVVISKGMIAIDFKYF